MTRSAVRSSLAALVALLLASTAQAQVLTADSAVEIALRQNPQVVFAKASVLDARAGLYGAYSGVLPNIGASWTRSGQQTDNATGSQIFGSVVFPSRPYDSEGYSTSPSISGNWNILDLRVQKAFGLGGGTKLMVFGDLLNTFNDEAFENVLDRRGTSTNFAVPSRFFLPRRLMLGAKLTF